LLHIDSAGKVETSALRAVDAHLALAADDHPALVFAKRESDRISLMLSWNLGTGKAVEIDRVSVPGQVAKIALDSRVPIAVAADGEHELGIAWRPLTTTKKIGSYDWDHFNRPGPETVDAEVRWVVVSPSGAEGGIHHARTTASPVTVFGGMNSSEAVYYGNGLNAATWNGAAFFVWLDNGNVVGVRASGLEPVVLAKTYQGALGGPALQLRSHQGQFELLVLGSGVFSYRLDCR
jgi:hypothetical protein